MCSDPILAWRNIKQEKPAEGQDCITKTRHGIIQGTYSSKDNSFFHYYWRDIEWYATHWVPAEKEKTMGIQERVKELEAELAELKQQCNTSQEFTEGEPGWFLDNRHGPSYRYFGYYKETLDSECPHGRTDDKGGYVGNYEHFEPLKTVILPKMIKHDGYECPVKPGQRVVAKLRNGKILIVEARFVYWYDDFVEHHRVVEYCVLED